MPVLSTPEYKPPFPLRNPHIHTVYPVLFRPVPPASPVPERLELPDGDFLDIDWHKNGSKKTEDLAIISHGLEGNSRRKYPLGMALRINLLGKDAVCINCRGCSGPLNRLPRLYHSGVTDDLHFVARHCITWGYKRVFLVGFSMGGNQNLKYLGETPEVVPAEICGSVNFSVPCNLSEAEKELNKPRNRIYLPYFFKSLRKKVYHKAETYPSAFDPRHLKRIRTFREFDECYTAPVHGFRDAEDYYRRTSCRQFLRDIRIPSLLVQAADDPFLSSSCYPRKEAETNPKLFLEIPRYGGHVGFYLPGRDNIYWSENVAAGFLQHICR